MGTAVSQPMEDSVPCKLDSLLYLHAPVCCFGLCQLGEVHATAACVALVSVRGTRVRAPPPHVTLPPSTRFVHPQHLHTQSFHVMACAIVEARVCGSSAAAVHALRADTPSAAMQATWTLSLHMSN